MKEILSKSKMREVIQLPPDKSGKKRTAVFVTHTKKNPVYTELSNPDFKFLTDQGGGPFNFLINEGTFIVVVDNNDDDPPSKLDIEIDKLLAEKEKKESGGKKFKSESILKKLIEQREEAKTRQGN